MRKIVLILFATCAIVPASFDMADAKRRTIPECKDMTFVQRLQNWRECQRDSDRGRPSRDTPSKPDRPSGPCGSFMILPGDVLANGNPEGPDKPEKPDPVKPEKPDRPKPDKPSKPPEKPDRPDKPDKPTNPCT